MFVFWIFLAALAYILLLGCVLAFFSAVSRMNHRWERAFREANSAHRHEDWFRAA
jgi:hypothetical protein